MCIDHAPDPHAAPVALPTADTLQAAVAACDLIDTAVQHLTRPLGARDDAPTLTARVRAMLAIVLPLVQQREDLQAAIATLEAQQTALIEAVAAQETAQTTQRAQWEADAHQHAQTTAAAETQLGDLQAKIAEAQEIRHKLTQLAYA